MRPLGLSARIEPVPEVLLVPTLGPLHLKEPRYNAVTVLELIRSFQPEAIVLFSYSDEDLSRRAWRDEEDLALFHLVPWAEERGVVLIGGGEEVGELRREGEHFRRYLGEMEKGREYLRAEEERYRELAAALSPLSPERLPEVLPAIEAYNAWVDATYGRGPASGFREERVGRLLARLKDLSTGRVAVVADALDLPALLSALPEAKLPRKREPSEAERRRAVMDRAWLLAEEDDPAQLLAQLAEIESPEARFLMGQIYLAHGELAGAEELLRQASEEDFSLPEYLPGYLLARLGQVRDLLGEREAALRAYRGVMALSWAPKEAREIAQAGLRSPFRLP